MREIRGVVVVLWVAALGLLFPGCGGGANSGGSGAQTDSLSAADTAADVSDSAGQVTDSGLGDTAQPVGEPHASCLDDNTIHETPSTAGSYLLFGFTRYVEVVAPNGKAVRIYAHPDVSDAMVIRARNLLRFFLTDVPGSQYGADKSAVADAMASNTAVLMLPNGAHEEGNEPPLNAQPLYWAEMSIEGSKWYMENDFEHRDASFEEIFHLVHDAGIGTYMAAALPQYQAELLAEAKKAIADGRWGIPVDPFVPQWLKELEAEDSLAQEYIASVIDSYYGLWGPWTEAAGGMWGIYIAKTRAEIAEKDPAGKALLEKFLSPWLTYEAYLDPSLNGVFEMTFDAAKPYTHKSQYLLHARLTGANNSGLLGNDQDNALRGNTGDNSIDGAGGTDTAVYCQPRATYLVTRQGDDLLVSGPDGSDTLKRIGVVHFSDGPVDAAAF